MIVGIEALNLCKRFDRARSMVTGYSDPKARAEMSEKLDQAGVVLALHLKIPDVEAEAIKELLIRIECSVK